MVEDLIKASMSSYLEDVAKEADCEVGYLYDLLIEIMQEEGFLQSDIQRVYH